MRPNKIGQIVKFKEPNEDENTDEQYVILEIADDADAHRAKIKAIGYNNPFIPINNVNLDEIEVVSVSTKDMIKEKVDILTENGEYATGRVIDTNEDMIYLEMTKEGGVIVTNAILTIRDTDGKEHQGRYIFKGTTG